MRALDIVRPRLARVRCRIMDRYSFSSWVRVSAEVGVCAGDDALLVVLEEEARVRDVGMRDSETTTISPK